MRYKLLACDLDGTLLNSSAEFTPGNISAIRRAVESGMNVVIASGRSHASINRFNQALGLNCKNSYGISFNGAVVYNAGTMEILYERRITEDVCEKIYKAVKSYDPKAPLILYTMSGDTVYYEEDDEHIERYYNYTTMSKQRVPSLLELTNGGVAKFIVRCDPEDVRKMKESISHELKDSCELIISAPHLLEFGVLGNNKACGLKFLAEYLGIRMDEVAAIGDNYNDLEMIQAAGKGFAVANAVDELKAHADYVTSRDNDNDAVAEVIEMLLA